MEMADAEKRDPQTYAAIGAAMEVHRELGPGFLEPVYQEALARELSIRGIPFEREVRMNIYYKGECLNTPYRADYVLYGEVLMELKALEKLTPREESQVLNYLNASRMKRALLINFGGSSLAYKRFVL